MCVTEYSDLFLDLLSEYKPIPAFMEVTHMVGKS